MSDITMCAGTNCPLKEGCYRFTAPKNEYRQSYFTIVPIVEGVCEHFYEDMYKPKRHK